MEPMTKYVGMATSAVIFGYLQATVSVFVNKKLRRLSPSRSDYGMNPSEQHLRHTRAYTRTRTHIRTRIRTRTHRAAKAARHSTNTFSSQQRATAIRAQCHAFRNPTPPSLPFKLAPLKALVRQKGNGGEGAGHTSNRQHVRPVVPRRLWEHRVRGLRRRPRTLQTSQSTDVHHRHHRLARHALHSDSGQQVTTTRHSVDKASGRSADPDAPCRSMGTHESACNMRRPLCLPGCVNVAHRQ